MFIPPTGLCSPPADHTLYYVSWQWLWLQTLPETLGGGWLMTNAVPWLNGRFGARKNGAGIFAWHSMDGQRWTYCGTVATAAQFPTSGEGPNENDVAILADGRTVMVVFRIDDGVDGGKVDAKNYQASTSTDGGKTWATPHEMLDVNGRGIGVARPRLLMLGEGGLGGRNKSGGVEETAETTLGAGQVAPAPLLLSGGRLYTENTRDILLWVCWDGMGLAWNPFSISYQHNRLVSPSTLRFSADVNATSGRATTSYTSLLPVGSPSDRTAVLIYNGDTGMFAMTISVM